jgi:hypothetical protein
MGLTFFLVERQASICIKSLALHQQILLVALSHQMYS